MLPCYSITPTEEMKKVISDQSIRSNLHTFHHHITESRESLCSYGHLQHLPYSLKGAKLSVLVPHLCHQLLDSSGLSAWLLKQGVFSVCMNYLGLTAHSCALISAETAAECVHCINMYNMKEQHEKREHIHKMLFDWHWLAIQEKQQHKNSPEATYVYIEVM